MSLIEVFFFFGGGTGGGGGCGHMFTYRSVVLCAHTVDVKILWSDVVRPSGCPFIF